MKKQLILHIGIHKTGSTSIQAALKGYNKNKVKYVAFEEINHSIPMYTIFSENRYNYHIWQKVGISNEDIDKKKNTYLNILMKEFMNNKVETLIISGEDLSGLKDHEVKKLSEFLTAQQITTTVICYVRDPLSWAVSASQEMAKNGGTTPNLDNMFEFRIQKYIKYFGKKNIKVFDYEKSSVSEKSIVRHFSRELSIDLKDLPHANKSLNPLQFSLLQNLNNIKFKEKRHLTRNVIASKIIKIGLMSPLYSDKKLDKQYFKNLIPDCYEEDCNWLNNEFGIQYKIDLSTKQKSIDCYHKMILSNSFELIINLFKEIGLRYNPTLNLQDNYINAYIFIETGIDNFSGNLYLELNPQLKKVVGLNPYKHFLVNGFSGGRRFQ